MTRVLSAFRMDPNVDPSFTPAQQHATDLREDLDLHTQLQLSRLL